MKAKANSYMIEMLPNLWSFPPAGCTRVQSSGLSEGGTAVGADPPPSCAGASPLWPTCAGDIPTHKDRPWPGQSPHGDDLCLFCPCWSPSGFDNLSKDMKWVDICQRKECSCHHFDPEENLDWASRYLFWYQDTVPSHIYEKMCVAATLPSASAAFWNDK